MKLEISKRIKRLPPYLFAEIDREKSKLKEKGAKFIDLTIGDPDILAPESVIERLYESAKLKENQKYSLDQGKYTLRKAISNWFNKRFNVKVDENKEILPLIGSKEGIVHFPLCLIDKDDYIIIPDPGYPGYRGAGILSDAKIYQLPLLEKNFFLPDLDKIPNSIRNKAKIIYLNYPNNPTTVVAPYEFLEKVVKFCAKYGIVLAYDNAYSEIYFEKKPISIFEIKGAKEIAIEFHSFSKTFCMTGFRIGWAVSNEEIIKLLLKVKTNIDSGIFGAIQEASIIALEKEEQYTENLRKIFKERRDIFLEGLRKKGFVGYSESTFYVWTKLPKNFKSSLEFCKYLLEKNKILITPGIGFGKYGEGFIRFALTVDKELLKEAISLL